MKPTVILLHGLARTHRSLSGMRRHLERAGYPTWARTYDWRSLSLPDLAADTAARIRAEVKGEVVAVTHSYGGIVVRHMKGLIDFRATVMIAPPNQGSRIALAMKDYRPYQWLHGRSGQEVTTAERWPAPPLPFGVIAGTRAMSVVNPVSWLARGLNLIPKDVPSDGTVSVEETRHPDMADFATVDASHTFILEHPEVRKLVVNFLESGLFQPGK